MYPSMASFALQKRLFDRIALGNASRQRQERSTQYPPFFSLDRESG